MSGPTDLLGLLCAITVGWGIWRWHRRFLERSNPMVVIALWSVVGSALWMLLLALVGVGWPTWLIVLPSLVALPFGLAVRRAEVSPDCRPLVWALGAAILAGAHAALLALQPASGWDFRYLWGLKAKVFALAATHDTSWLSWPPNGWLHPEYPPLWPDLIAMGVRLGGSAEGVAALWQAFLVLALAAACWDNLRQAPNWVRFTGAAVGALAPAVFSPGFSGYADPVVAFLAAVALGSLVRLRRGGCTPVRPTLAAAIAGLCLSKNEGMVLAFGVTLAVVWVGDRRDRILAAIAFAAPVGSWQLFVVLNSIRREPRSLDPHAWLVAAHETLFWLWVHLPSSVGLLLLAWLLAGVALARRMTLPVVVALGVWWCGLVAAYLTSLQGTEWHLPASFARVIATPLPAVLSVALAASTGAPGERPPSRDPEEAGP